MDVRYLLCKDRQILGPFEPLELAKVPGFDESSLVCPEDRTGFQPYDWERARNAAEVMDVLRDVCSALESRPAPPVFEPPKPAPRLGLAQSDYKMMLAALDKRIELLEEGLERTARASLELGDVMSKSKKILEGLDQRIGSLEEGVERNERTCRDIGLDCKDSKDAVADLAARVASLADGVKAASPQRAFEEIDKRIGSLSAGLERLEKMFKDVEAGLARRPDAAALEIPPVVRPSEPAAGPDLWAAPLDRLAMVLEPLGRQVAVLEARMEAIRESAASPAAAPAGDVFRAAARPPAATPWWRKAAPFVAGAATIACLWLAQRKGSAPPAVAPLVGREKAAGPTSLPMPETIPSAKVASGTAVPAGLSPAGAEVPPKKAAARRRPKPRMHEELPVAELRKIIMTEEGLTLFMSGFVDCRTATFTDPPRLLLDIGGARNALEGGPPDGKGDISGVEVEASKEGKKPGLRVYIGLTRPLLSKVEVLGDRIEVKVLP